MIRLTAKQQVVAERKLAELEQYLPEHWELINRAWALEEVLKPNGSIYCIIHHNKRGKLITRLPSAFCRRLGQTMRALKRYRDKTGASAL